MAYALIRLNNDRVRRPSPGSFNWRLALALAVNALLWGLLGLIGWRLIGR